MWNSDWIKQGASAFLDRIKLRAILCLLMLHLGAAVALAALVRGRAAFAADPLLLGLTLAAFALMYGSFLVAVLSIWLPVRPWLARYRKLMQWREWIVHELPTLLALIPVLLSAVGALKAAWSELKRSHEDGELDAESLSKVAQKLAKETKKKAT